MFIIKILLQKFSYTKHVHPQNKQLIETSIMVSFNEMHGFYYEFQDTSSALFFIASQLIRSHNFCASIKSTIINNNQSTNLQTTLHIPCLADANPDGIGWLIASKLIKNLKKHIYSEKLLRVSMYCLFYESISWDFPFKCRTNENFKNNIWKQLKVHTSKFWSRDAWAHEIWNIKQITCHDRFKWEKLSLYFYYCRVCPQDGRKVRFLHAAIPWSSLQATG